MEELAVFMKHRKENYTSCLNNAIKLDIFTIFNKQRNSLLTKLAFDTYELKADKNIYIQLIEDLKKNHQYKEVCILISSSKKIIGSEPIGLYGWYHRAIWYRAIHGSWCVRKVVEERCRMPPTTILLKLPSTQSPLNFAGLQSSRRLMRYGVFLRKGIFLMWNGELIRGILQSHIIIWNNKRMLPIRKKVKKKKRPRERIEYFLKR